MARFGLSPYSNPVESILQSFGTGLKDISMLRELTSGNQERKEAQDRQLMDLNIANAQQRNQESEAEAPNRALERETKNKELHTKIATQTYGPGIDSAARKAKDSIPTGQPPQFSADEIAGVLGFADQHSHFGGTKNEEQERVEQAVAANKVQQNLVQLAPALAQHSQQSGQTMHRIDNTVVPGFIDDVNAAFKNSSVFDGKEVEALGVDAATGEVAVRVKGKDGLELLKDKDGNVKKFSVGDLQNMVNKSASFGNLVLSSYAQMHGNDALTKEVETKKKEIASTHGRLATLDEYADWEGKNPDATVAQKRTQIQKIGAKNGVDETTLDKIAKEQIAEKTDRRSGSEGKEVADKSSPTGWSYIGKGELNIPGAPPPKEEDAEMKDLKKGFIRSEIGRNNDRTDDKKDKADAKKKDAHDKLVKDKAAIIQKTSEGKEMSDDEVQEEAERLATAQEKGLKPGKSAKKSQTERLKPLKDKVAEAEESGVNVPLFGQAGGIDMDDLVKKTAESGYYTKQELEKVFTGERGKKALEKYQSSKPAAKKSATPSTIERQLPPRNSGKGAKASDFFTN